jgi:hypothetical protein
MSWDQMRFGAGLEESPLHVLGPTRFGAGLEESPLHVLGPTSRNHLHP